MQRMTTQKAVTPRRQGRMACDTIRIILPDVQGDNMSIRPYDKAKTLKKLGKQDFRHMTKEHAVQLVSMLDRVSPEVAMKALEQVPYIANVAIESAQAMRKSAVAAIHEGRKVSQSTLTNIDHVITVLETERARTDTSEAHRERALDGILELARLSAGIDRESKRHSLDVLRTVGGYLSVAGMTVVSAVGRSL